MNREAQVRALEENPEQQRPQASSRIQTKLVVE